MNYCIYIYFLYLIGTTFKVYPNGYNIFINVFIFQKLFLSVYF